MGSDRWIRAVLLASFVAIAGCDDEGSKKSCADGATKACDCGGSAGEQVCEKGAFSSCVCGAKPDGGGSVSDLGQLKGRVFDAESGRAIDSAELKTESGESTKSDAKGNFELPSKKEPGSVVVSKENYAQSVKAAPKKGGYMEVFIKDVDKTQEFDADDGVKVSLKSGASIDIPPGSVKDDKGQPVKGMVTLYVTDVDGAERKQASAMPGDLKGESKGIDGKITKGRVGIHRALEITILDKEGKSLSVGKADKVVAEFPDKGAGSPAESHGFSFDKQKAAWVDEGKVKRSLNDKGEHVYTKDIDHLSWHAYGDFFDVLTCVKTCVTDGDKKPLEGAQVWMVGASYPGVDNLFTGEDGCAFGAAPVKQEIVLVAQIGTGVSKAGSFVTGRSEQNSVDNPDQCGKPETLVIGEATPGGCPFGFTECGGVCTDLATDPNHCGKCGAACGGTDGREVSCSAGSCGCPEGTTTCGSGVNLACADTKTDPQNCGMCGNDVTAGGKTQANCVDGEAVAVRCNQNEQFCDNVCVNTKHNEANCGGCGTAFACQAGEVCLDECKPSNDLSLCSGGEVKCGSVDSFFCDGVPYCDVQSPLAYPDGCTPGSIPCIGVGICRASDVDPSTGTCDGQCYPKYLNPPPIPTQGTSPQCSRSFSPCLVAVAADPKPTDKRLGSAFECGAQPGATPKDPPAAPYNDEFYSGQVDCSDCLRIDLMICARRQACGTQVDALYCCGDVWKCGDQDCLLEHCRDKFEAVDICLNKTTCYAELRDGAMGTVPTGACFR